MLWVVALGALLLLAYAPPGDAATKVRRYTPYTKTGEIKPSIRITERRDGECDVGGIGGRSDAWRCVTGHFIYDPCFESPIADIAVCPRLQQRGDLLLRDPDFNREYQSTNQRGRVWAVRVRGKGWCVASTGARSEVRGRVPLFFCNGGESAVWGQMDRRKPTWLALVGRYDEPERWRWRKVARAWR